LKVTDDHLCIVAGIAAHLTHTAKLIPYYNTIIIG
jgi:hypothetical protein